MPDRNELIDIIVRTAEAWRDPDYEPRARAVEATLAATDTFTEEAIAYAINQQMALVTPDALRNWAPEVPVERPKTVGVLNAGNIPFVELQDFLAVLLAGHRYVGAVSSRSPALLPAFADRLPAEFVEAEELFERVDAVIATGSDETAAWVDERCEANGIVPENRLIRGHRYSVAIIDGREPEEMLEQLAEDVLLHEGQGCRNVAVIWAPEGHSPDDLLDAMAHFRGVFPAHKSTPGRLKMKQAFLEAVDAPHACGEGLEFLMSKGEPEPQQPGHVRWTEYAGLDEVRSWVAAHRQDIQLVVARSDLHDRLDAGITLVTPGTTQRPPLDWRPDGVDVMTFLQALQ